MHTPRFPFLRSRSVLRWPAVAVLALAALVACGPAEPDRPPAAEEGAAAAEAPQRLDWALAIHGGAGVTHARLPEEETPPYRESLERALAHGRDLLAAGEPALDVVESVIRLLEDDPLFNAGKGAVFTSEGTNELDAAIMDGRDLSCGAVSGIQRVKNPISLARKVMTETRHVFLVGEGAETFAQDQGLEMVDPKYFFVQARYDRWQEVAARQAKEEQAQEEDGLSSRGTVGAVALDRDGNLAAATSTGGLTNKRFGRVGDVPVIGAGTYANNATCAVSCTGIGEQFIRNAVAHDVSALMEYKGLSVEAAAREVIDGKLRPDDGGLIAVARDGSVALVFNTEGMFRGAADASGRFEVGIFDDLAAP